MAKLFFLVVIFLATTNVPNCKTDVNEDNRQLTNILEAAKSFKSLYKIKSWIIHYDDLASKYLLRGLFKETKDNFGYIRLNYLPFQRNISRTPQRTSHIFIAQNFEYLRHLIDESEHIPNDVAMSEFKTLGNEKWLIFATQASRRQRSSVLTVLKSLPIRFDSSIFVFYKDDGGKKSVLKPTIIWIKILSNDNSIVFTLTILSVSQLRQ